MELPEFLMANLRPQEENLVVFMCRKCRLPLGDSNNYSAAMHDQKLPILLNAVSKFVIIHGEKILNNSKDKNGSLFQILQCKGCESAVGRFLLSGPKEMDNYLQKFVLDADEVTIYSLGFANKQIIPTSEEPVTLLKSRECEEEIKKCKVLLGKLQKKVDAMEDFLSS